MTDKPKPPPRPTWAEWVSELLRVNNWTYDQLGQQLGGLSRSTVCSWVKGKKVPSTAAKLLLKRLAKGKSIKP